jgi:Ni/Co efflux regulator RcnB
MRMLKALVPAALVSMLAATSASATPAVAPLAQLKTGMPADTVKVQDHEGRRHERRSVHREARDQRYTPGQHYDRAPSHYRRHADRPRDWHSRGCIRVGPAWFCP